MQSTDINAKSEEKSTITAMEFVILLDGLLLKMCDVKSFNPELTQSYLKRKECHIYGFTGTSSKIATSLNSVSMTTRSNSVLQKPVNGS